MDKYVLSVVTLFKDTVSTTVSVAVAKSEFLFDFNDNNNGIADLKPWPEKHKFDHQHVLKCIYNNLLGEAALYSIVSVVFSRSVIHALTKLQRDLIPWILLTLAEPTFPPQNCLMAGKISALGKYASFYSGGMVCNKSRTLNPLSKDTTTLIFSWLKYCPRKRNKHKNYD